MPPLTSAELTRLRMLTGGVTAASEPDHLTDAQLQAEHTAGGEDFDTTLLRVLRLRVGMTAALTDRSYAIEQTSEQLSQRHQQLKALLEYWERKLGALGAKLNVSSIDLCLRESDDV